MYYAISLIFSHLTFSQVQRPSQFVFKLLLCTLLLNYSSTICQFFVDIVSKISLAVRIIGEEVLRIEISFATLIENLNIKFPIVSQEFNLFSFDGLMRSLIYVGFMNLAISYSLRYIMIQVFCLIFPFAILCLSIEKFSWIFKSWLKIFFSLLFLQILVSCILLIAFSLETLEDGTFTSLLHLGSIYSLIKANSFIKDFMGGLSTDVNTGISSIKSLISKNN